MKRFIAVGVAVLLVAAAVAGFLLTRPRTASKLPIKTNDPWLLHTNDPNQLVSGTTGALYGTYIGDGYIGTQIGPEGVGSFEGKPLPCLMTGLYEGEALKGLPNWSDFPIYDSSGRRFTLDTEAPYRQTLNLGEGYVQTELTLKSGRQRLTGKVTAFIDHVPHSRLPDYDTGTIHYDLTPSFTGSIGVTNKLDAAGWKVAQSTSKGTYSHVALSTREGLNVTMTSQIYSKGVPAGGLINCTRGKALDLTKVARIAVWGESRPSEVALASPGYEAAFSGHRKWWQERWKSDIVIDGDPAAQQAVHAMMFYLLCSASPSGSIPPVGLSGGAWQGHIFWDADTWMFPALLLQHPEEAAGIVNYRMSTAKGAAENAAKRGLAGLEYAWESARTGRETAPKPYSEERHVTADVAIAASNRPWVQADSLIYRTAEYWASRCKYNKVKDRYEIFNVVPPDEDAEIVDNSVYTNAAAKRNIELAIALAKKEGKKYPGKWDEIAAKMYIPFDPKTQRFVEYDGYKGGRTKQADTELLIYPLAYPMTEAVKKNTFDFYKTKTDRRGPAMTSSIHAILAAELGRPEEAYKHFQDSYQPFMRGPMMIFNEKRSRTYDNMCFLTGCGGSLQSVIYGFGGLRVGRAPKGFEQVLPGLFIKPCLPPKWKKLEIRDIKWQGKRYDLTVTPGSKWSLKEAMNH